MDERSGRRYRLRGAPIIHDTIDNETIAINQLSGAYYSLDGPSAQAWQLLADGVTVGDIAARLAAQYAEGVAELADATAQFVDQLLAEELIVVLDEGTEEPAGAAPPPADATPAIGRRGSFPGLHLQRYTDLEVLLLADPIHEVDETGWPMPLADRDR